MAVSPLWLDQDASADLLPRGRSGRSENFSTLFRSELNRAVGSDPAAENVFAYIYAVLWSKSYRHRYSDFIKRDFPRVPLVSNRDVFSALVTHGEELVSLHTMRVMPPRVTRFDVAGSNEVVKVRWADELPSQIGGQAGLGRVYINQEQYFGAVPLAVWEMHIGGYRVAEKWLKDRRGRQLSYDDLTHYQSVIAALARTLALQHEIDSVIELAGGWPLR